MKFYMITTLFYILERSTKIKLYVFGRFINTPFFNHTLTGTSIFLTSEVHISAVLGYRSLSHWTCTNVLGKGGEEGGIVQKDYGNRFP